MSAPKWTPGPLTVRQDEKISRWAYVVAPNGRTIADVWNVPGTHGAQALADATLYAAAPDLAAVCEVLIRQADADPFMTVGHFVEHVVNARVALAKARGES